MFSNSGGKLKTIAIVWFVLGCIASVVLTIVLINTTRVYSGSRYSSGSYTYNWWLIFVVPPIGVLFSWLSSLGLYAFGSLVESNEEHTYQNHQILKELEKINSAINALQKSVAPANAQVVFKKAVDGSDGKWRCKKCGSDNGGLARFCGSCGAYK